MYFIYFYFVLAVKVHISCYFGLFRGSNSVLSSELLLYIYIFYILNLQTNETTRKRSKIKDGNSQTVGRTSLTPKIRARWVYWESLIF